MTNENIEYLFFIILFKNYFINIEYSIQSVISMSQWKSGWVAETRRLLNVRRVKTLPRVRISPLPPWITYDKKKLPKINLEDWGTIEEGMPKVKNKISLIPTGKDGLELKLIDFMFRIC